MIRLLLVFVFIVVPILELAIIVQVGDLIGLFPTIALLLLVSVVGAWLVRREGTRAWGRFTSALRSGKVPADEVLHGALVLFGGALLLTPGFFTDAVGLALMIPPIRAVVATALKRQLGARFTVAAFGGAAGAGQRRVGRPGQRPGTRTGAAGPSSPAGPSGAAGASGASGASGGAGAPGARQNGAAWRGQDARDEVIDVEVVSVERNTDDRTHGDNGGDVHRPR